MESQITNVKKEVVKQFKGVLVDVVNKECHSEVVALGAELEESKQQMKRLEEQLQNLT